MNRLFLLSACLLLSILSTAQRPPETESEYDKDYQRRIQMETINGVYIPANLPEAFVQLHQLIDKDSKGKFKEMEEEAAVKKLHFSLGRWMIINWGFYQGSRLSHSLKVKGLHHPDDMARFIIRSYHRSLNKVPIEAESQIKGLTEAREQERQDRMKQGEVLEQWTQPVKEAEKETPDSGGK
jgi:hypothetical protein